MAIKKIYCLIAALFLFSVVAPMAYSAELPAGTIISKDNVDKIMNDTFEGHTIKSLLSDVQLLQIRDWNLKIKIKNSTPQKTDPRYIEATKKFKGTLKYDPATNECSGFQAGKPFPDMTKDDPDFAAKLVWRFYYGARTGNTQHYPHNWLFINNKTGLERLQEWYWLRYYTKGVLPNFAKGESPVVNEEYLSKTLFFVTAPFDLKGVGLFTLRYDSPKLEDSWVYIKSVRRTRRLSGGAWIDPVGGTDVLYDDVFIINARPSWYTSFKVLETKHVLVAANQARSHGETINFDPKAKEPAKAYKRVDLENAPYWNPSTLVDWEPIEVHIIECTPPERHPYSKRVIYMDTRDPVVYMGDCYDKAGKLWKFLLYTMSPVKSHDGFWTFVPYQGFCSDFKQMHASIFYSVGVTLDSPDIQENDVNLGELRKAGR